MVTVECVSCSTVEDYDNHQQAKNSGWEQREGNWYCPLCATNIVQEHDKELDDDINDDTGDDIDDDTDSDDDISIPGSGSFGSGNFGGGGGAW